MTTEQALIYITECTLATVAHQTYLKKKTMGEYDRQISIAQKSIDGIMANKLKARRGERVYMVIEHYDGDVQKWIRNYL